VICCFGGTVCDGESSSVAATTGGVPTAAGAFTNTGASVCSFLPPVLIERS
jgi:hypothetical protein